ncbi:MAG: hypothetical protein QXU64_03300 [Thermofilaceae archaeon]
MGYVKRIIDKVISLQDRLDIPELREYKREGEGKVGLLRVEGVGGESVLLKVENGRLVYARGDETPHHVFRCSIDTLLDLVTGEIDLRDAITMGYFVIESATTGEIDLVELERWAKAFERLKWIIDRYVRGVISL